MPDQTAALAAAEALFPTLVEELKKLIRIPSCSFPGFDHSHIERSAEATAALLRWAGYPQVEIARMDGVFPYVLAFDHRAGPGEPTLLLYAHHDVQPPLREAVWTTPPFEPVERDGRLYARGAADDKAGIMMHAFSARAWNDSAGRPPVNLSVVIEGEEEIGSPHFGAFLRAHRERLAADALVIADLANFDTGLPSLTTSLRGHVAVEVELKALRSPLHSGMWGGAVPDAAMALCRLLATLSDDAGRIAIPGIYDAVTAPTAAELADLARLPYDAARFAEQAGLLASRADADPVAVHRRLWREPALAITSVQSGVRGQTGNVIMDAAWGRVGIRIVPHQDPHAVQEALCAHLRRHAPAGMELVLTPRGEPAPAWSTATGHPAFAAARRALRTGFGVEPVAIGCGASIPFVGEMTAALGGIPALLLGVEDPVCAAHAENESVHLGDLLKALRSQTALFAELAGS
jgi:acetylornithine deacetylase/succinyl-diaminopimelate desuccinylase-like protein